MPLSSVIFIISKRLDHVNLLKLRGVNRELRAIASDDHMWSSLACSIVEDFELGENELVEPTYPVRDHGAWHDDFSFFPNHIDSIDMAGYVLPRAQKYHPAEMRIKDGVLEDKFEKKIGHRTEEVYKARPLPLLCVKCGIYCESYGEFTVHCTLPAHKIKLDPSRRYDPRFIHERFNDPRHSLEFEGKSMMSQFAAIHSYKRCMKKWFYDSCPEKKPNKAYPLCQFDAWDVMKAGAKNARENVRFDAKVFHLSDDEVRTICAECTPLAAVDSWLSIILSDWEERGLEGYALEVVQNGWKNLEQNGTHSRLLFLIHMTGLNY